MNDLLDENEQWEAIKNWWQQNGIQLIIMLIIGLAIGFGWRYWQANLLEKKEQASQLFDQLLSTQTTDSNSAMIGRIAGELEENYSRTVYAPLAALFEAKRAVAKNDLPTAEEKLRWSEKHAKTSTLRDITQIRLARVLLAEKKPDQALALLEKIKNTYFSAAIEQVKGDIYLAQGQTTKARTAYQQALNATPTSQPLRSYVEMQLNQLPAQ